MIFKLNLMWYVPDIDESVLAVMAVVGREGKDDAKTMALESFVWSSSKPI